MHATPLQSRAGVHSVDGRALYACPISGDTPVHGPARAHACTGGAEVTVSQVQAEIARLETQAEAARLSKSHWSLLRLLSGAGDILTALNAPGAAAQFQRRLLTQSAELVNLPVSIRLHVKLALSLRLSCAEHGELGGAEEGEGGLAMEAAQLLTRAEGDMSRWFVCCCPLLLWLASSPQTDVCVCARATHLSLSSTNERQQFFAYIPAIRTYTDVHQPFALCICPKPCTGFSGRVTGRSNACSRSSARQGQRC